MSHNPTYEAYRQAKIESGCCFQDFISDLILRETGIPLANYSSRLYQLTVGESRQGFEIKHDEKYATSGNLYIEIAEKARPRAGDYVPSGIFRSDNTWQYIIGDYDEVFIFQQSFLRVLATSGRYPIIENRTKTSKGFLLPAADARKVAGLVLAPKADRRIVKGTLDDLLHTGKALYRLLTSDPAQQELFKDPA
jgi:hypothetical protein